MVIMPDLRSSWATRLGSFLLVLWGVLSVNFLLPRLLPGDPIVALADPSSDSEASLERLAERLESVYGMGGSFAEQYLLYLGRFLTGDLGTSFRLGVPVRDLVASHVGWTLLLIVPSLLVATAIGIGAGAEAASRRGTWLDRTLIMAFSLTRGLPVQLIAMLLLMTFAVRLGWFPIGGAKSSSAGHGWWGAIVDVLWHWALPAAVVTVGLIGVTFLVMRGSMVTVAAEPYLLMARAKGLSRRAVRYRHAARNAILPVLTGFGARLGTAVSGVVIVETVFGYPGVGSLAAASITARDYPVLEAVFVVISVCVLVMNLVVDGLYRFLDPRVRAS